MTDFSLGDAIVLDSARRRELLWHGLLDGSNRKPQEETMRMCDYCQICEAAYFQVEVALGGSADLCPGCAKKHCNDASLLRKDILQTPSTRGGVVTTQHLIAWGNSNDRNHE